MKNKLSILSITIALVIALTIIISSQNNTQNNIPEVKQITRNFNQWVTISLNNSTNVYNNEQAEIILNDFIRQNNIKELIETKSQNSAINNTIEYYAQNELNESFKIYATITNLNNKLLITNLTITIN